MSTQAERKKIIQQRIHREELKLARLKNQSNKQRRQDARMKLRLGGFIFTLGWNEVSLEILSDRLSDIVTFLKSSDPEILQEMKILGENTLRELVQDHVYEPVSPGMTSEERRKDNHEKITLGGLLVKHELHNFDRGTLFGALLKFNRSDYSSNLEKDHD